VELPQVLAAHDFDGAGRVGTFEQRNGAERVDAIIAAERIRRYGEAVIAEHTAALFATRRRHLGTGPIVADEPVVADEPADLDAPPSGRHRPGLVDERDLVTSVVTETAMARQISSGAAQNALGFARVLQHPPHTAQLLEDGSISYRVAKAVSDECTNLCVADRGVVDAQLAPGLPTMTARRAGLAARRLVIGIDPDHAEHMAVEARHHRGVWITAAPDAMGRLCATLPADQAVACFTALDGQARGLKADGDARTINQLMADTLVERLTGQTRAADVAAEIGLLMRPETLFADEDTPAVLAGYGPIPPGIARNITGHTKVWARRLFTRPAGGENQPGGGEQIIGRDPRRRRFDGPLGDLIGAVDQHCQRPWCDHHIDDIDHRTPYTDGGTTTAADGDAYCRSSHTTKHLPGFTIRREDIGTGAHQLAWTTPTAHTYTSQRPPPLGHGPHVATPKTPPGASVAERHLQRRIGTHTAIPATSTRTTGHLRQ
jgi:hypothetical protein